jgi:hypothetical protein
MRIIEAGRLYLLKNFSGNGHQEIKFNRRRFDGTYSEGTTVEELLRVLRDKFYHFDNIAPSPHNKLCIQKIEDCLSLMLLRLAEKKDTLNKEK